MSAINEIDGSDVEFKTAVSAYLEMLQRERHGAKDNKLNTSRRVDATDFSELTESFIDFKMQNISAVMEELGLPHIKRYAPSVNIEERAKAKIVKAISDTLFPSPSSTEPVEKTKERKKALMVKDLHFPVTAVKSDWSPADGWMGFTPTGTGPDAPAKCQATIYKQINNGYVIEYITKSIQTPNPAFKNDPDYLKTRKDHAKLAGRIIAVHKLRASSRPLKTILGEKAYEHLQDVWAVQSKRVRWSVAFPIVETYRIIGSPLIKDILTEKSYKSLIQRSSATLRELTDEDRIAISELRIERVEARNSWIAIEDEIKNAEGSEINPDIANLINADLSAIEGECEERKIKIKKRAAWLAESFVKKRIRADQLSCDHCGYNPKTILFSEKKYYRSLLDVHHTNPVSEGVRYTTENDFELLCPNCHRLEHVRMRIKQDGN